MTMKRVVRRSLQVALVYLTLLVATICSVGPIVWIIMTSLKPQRLIEAIPPYWAFVPTLANYQTIFWYSPYGQFALNSVIVSAGATLVALALGLPAAYAFARFEFRLKPAVRFVILTARFTPFVALVLPYFLMMEELRLMDTQLALILIYTTFTLPFAAWLMVGFIEAVPIETEEAAWIDGCSRLQAAVRVTFPMIAPGIATAALLLFITAWNEFFFGVVLTSRRATTLQVGVMSFVENAQVGNPWGWIAAASTVAMAPLLVLAAVGQRYLVGGLTMGAVKG